MPSPSNTHRSIGDLAQDLRVMCHPIPVEGWTALNRGMRDQLHALGVPKVNCQSWGITGKIARAASKLGLIRNLARLGKRRIVTLTWSSDAPAFPDAYWCEIVPWIYDCWGQEWEKWEALLKRHRVRIAFFSTRQTAEHFAKRIPGLDARWMPECMDFSLLHPGKPLKDRTLHVFEMGRRLASMHDKVREPLKAAGKKHIYDQGPRSASAIPTLDELYTQMGDAAIIICFPKVMTHPAGAGGVETMTQRYLETLGSGALAVGACPKELADLMGFDPVVRLNLDDPARHLLEILDTLPKYQEMVDRAVVRVREIGTFQQRASDMLRAIAEIDARNT